MDVMLQTQAAKGTKSGDSEMVEEPQISWVSSTLTWAHSLVFVVNAAFSMQSEIDKIEAQARKEKEQDEPILVSNARRASDAIKKRQKSL